MVRTTRRRVDAPLRGSLLLPVLTSVLVLSACAGPVPDGAEPEPEAAEAEGARGLPVPRRTIRAFATTGMSVDSFRELGAKMQAGETGYAALLPVHHAFLSRGIPTLEQLVNVEAVAEEENALFVALPLKVGDGDGSPIRPAAFVY